LSTRAADLGNESGASIVGAGVEPALMRATIEVAAHPPAPA